jgi:hypothetical protein
VKTNLFTLWCYGVDLFRVNEDDSGRHFLSLLPQMKAPVSLATTDELIGNVMSRFFIQNMDANDSNEEISQYLTKRETGLGHMRFDGQVQQNAPLRSPPCPPISLIHRTNGISPHATSVVYCAILVLLTQLTQFVGSPPCHVQKSQRVESGGRY